MIRSRLTVVLGVVFLLPASVKAFMQGGPRAHVDFRSPTSKNPHGLSWSPNLRLDEAGLVLRAERKADVWFRSAAVPAGLAWRPPRSASMTIDLQGTFPADAFTARVRYSTDKKLWSDWRRLAPSNGGRTFHGEVEVPARSRRKFEALRERWIDADPGWRDDDDDLCRWIAKKQPAFFKKEIPVLGYLQYRLDARGLRPGAFISELTFTCSWSVSGLRGLRPGEERDSSWDDDWWFPFERPSPIRPPHPNPKGSAGGGSATKNEPGPGKAAPPPIKVSVDEMLALHDKNVVAADRKFENREVELSGYFGSVSRCSLDGLGT